MDKNPETVLYSNLSGIQNKFWEGNPNIILTLEPFQRIEFLSELINSSNLPIIFIDTDLLYTGYIKSKMIQKKRNVMIYCINKTNWKEKLSSIIFRISKEKSLVLIDSLNGIYRIFEKSEYPLTINSGIMLLSDIAKQNRTNVIITAAAKMKENDELALSPGGKHIVKSGKTSVFILKKNLNNYTMNPEKQIKTSDISY